MQPPRPRRRRERPSDAQILIAVILNGGAAVMTALLVGVAVRLSDANPHGWLARLAWATDLLTRPFERLPWISGTPSLILITLLAALAWLALLGIVRGWEAESRDHPRFSHRIRP
ncbi:MAG TPA: hypothetical protein VFI42_00280 [Thermomicrobiaceae bacterium]|nr:hypothetical protein [Thermomicrobiaceae bacterium]